MFIPFDRFLQCTIRFGLDIKGIFLFLSLSCSQCDTPKRRKHAPLEKVPSFASDVSSDAGETPLKLLSVLIDAIRPNVHGLNLISATRFDVVMRNVVSLLLLLFILAPVLFYVL